MSITLPWKPKDSRVYRRVAAKVKVRLMRQIRLTAAEKFRLLPVRQREREREREM